LIHQYADILLRVDTPTTRIEADGIGSIFTPSLTLFDHLTPNTAPQGAIFTDGSFLVFKEVFYYRYASAEATQPEILRTEYSYHYQRPQNRFFFRYDFHPELGDPDTHPLHHLHAFSWAEGDVKLSSIPRFSVSEITLGEVLELIKRDFLAT